MELSTGQTVEDDVSILDHFFLCPFQQVTLQATATQKLYETSPQSLFLPSVMQSACRLELVISLGALTRSFIAHSLQCCFETVQLVLTFLESLTDLARLSTGGGRNGSELL